MGITDTEFKKRISNFQEKMKEKNVDIAFVYGNDPEPLYLRYFTNFWPNFEAGALLVFQDGEPVVLTGPELGYYVLSVSQIKLVKIVYELKELSNPIYNDSKILSLNSVLNEAKSGNNARRLGVVGAELIPHIIWDVLTNHVEHRDLINLDEDVIELKSIKSNAELTLLRKSFEIAENAFEQLLKEIKPGMTEAEITAMATHLMVSLGAEASSFSLWCCSGPNTKHVIHRSTTRKIKTNELISIGIGCRCDGYCSSIGRSLVFGKLDAKSDKLVKDTNEIGETVIDNLVTGSNSEDIAKKIARISTKKGYSAIYGPAHSTGLVECEKPWIEKGNQFILKSGMVFNVDIWLEDANIGTRYENGVIVKDGKPERLSGKRKGLIKL